MAKLDSTTQLDPSQGAEPTTVDLSQGTTSTQAVAQVEEPEFTQEQVIETMTELGYTADEVKKMDVNALADIIENGTQKTTVPAVQTVTEDMVAGYPAAKSFVGKPVVELVRAIQESNSYIGKLTAAQNSQQLSHNINAQQNKKAPVLPDNTMDMSSDELQMLIQQKVQEAMQTTMNPYVNVLQQAQQEVQVKQLKDAIVNSLPPGTNVDLALFEFQQANQVLLQNPQMQQLYAQAPALLVRDIVQYNMQSKLSKENTNLSKNVKSEASKLAAKQLAASLRKANKRDAVNVNQVKIRNPRVIKQDGLPDDTSAALAGILSREKDRLSKRG